jgi:8-oxo-dGTP pyrophosphatase MutT (NUDIX family)
MNARIAPLPHANAAPTAAGAARLPRITVAAVVPDDGRFLFVEERVRGALVVNQPAGHLDPGESLVEAAVRETLEETGWRIEVTALVAVYHWPDPPDRKPVLRFTFAARPLGHDPDLPLDAGIVRPLWLTPADLVEGQHRLRSPLVERSVRDFLAGVRAPLSLLASISA